MVIVSERILFYRRGYPIIFEKLESDPYAKYCIRYMGNGHYYKTVEEAQAYVKKQFYRSFDPA